MSCEDQTLSDFWIGESLTVLAVVIENTRFYVRDNRRAEQVAELLEMAGGIPPILRRRPLSEHGINRVSYFVERANQIMRDMEQGIGLPLPETGPRKWFGFLLNRHEGRGMDARRTHIGRTSDASRMQIGRHPNGKGIMAEGLLKGK